MVLRCTMEITPAVCAGTTSAALLPTSAIGQAEEREAVRLGDYLCSSFRHKRLHRGTARRTGYKIGCVIKKVDGECAFTNKLTFVRRAPVATDEYEIGIRFADRDLNRRLCTPCNQEARCNGACGCARSRDARFLEHVSCCHGRDPVRCISNCHFRLLIRFNTATPVASTITAPPASTKNQPSASRLNGSRKTPSAST